MTTLLRLIASTLVMLLGLAAVPATATEDFLPPEQAFRFEARALDARNVEVAFTVAEGYYLYREQFAFAAEDASVRVGPAQIPPGKVKFDETFAKNVETYRGRVVIRVPVEAAPAAFTLAVTSQGCADAGLCYPPMQSAARVQLVGFGGDGRVSVQAVDGNAPAAGAGAGAVGTATAGAATSSAGASSSAATTLATAPGGSSGSSGDGGIDGALRSGHWWLVLGVFFGAGLLLSFTPCVAAPLAGELRYISQTRDVLLGGSALFALAAGMSVPLLLVGASAGALLPRAGAWMESVKRFFGVLLLGVAWWILSPVLSASVGVAGWGLLLLMSASLFGAFDRLGESAGAGNRLGKAFGVALALLGAAQIVGAMGGATDPLQPLQRFAQKALPQDAGAAGAGSFTARAAVEDAPRFQRVKDLAELDAAVRSAGRPVMLDFYADWCVSCKEMEKLTFNDPRVRARLDTMLLLQADVTQNSPADRALLKRFNLFGPPGILFFDAQGRELAAQRVIGYQDATRFLGSLAGVGA